MALPLYGIDKELAEKQASKFDPKREQEAREWISQATGEFLPENEDFMDLLKSGVLLCKLYNVIDKNNQIKFAVSTMPFKQMENISSFLNSAEKNLSMPKHELFQTIDLYEKKNPVQVIDCLFSLSRNAFKVGYEGPLLQGPKLSEKREVNFTEEQLKAGMFIPTKVSMGSAGGANASGMSYGNRRDIMDHRNKDVHNPVSSEPTQVSMGSVAGANQSNMGVSFANKRQIIDDKVNNTPVSSEPTQASMGSVAGANQSNMGVSFANKRQIVDK